MEIKHKKDGDFFEISIEAYSIIYLSLNPTYNCQLLSLAYFDSALRNNGKVFTYDLSELFKYIYVNITSKKLILIDLKASKNRDLFDEWIEQNNLIVIREKYISTNKSDMCLYLINIESLIK